MPLCSFVTHLRIQDHQRHAFDQECRLGGPSATDAVLRRRRAR
ncbi:hypothetical protein [uncultured Pseudacidovorax sp.]|nr:hypothetical protein [uncultured Pseudacidovorax sp.]